MTDILALLNRFENAAGVYERSDDPAARDELHAARRAIVEREAELVKALKPFADEWENVIGDPDDACLWEHCAALNWTVADVRRARAALRTTS